MATELRHEPAESRYALYIDGELIGVADYLLKPDSITFTHTGIAPDQRGGGLGAKLVKFALDDVRATGGLTVKPACWFVRDWFTKHPEDRDLLGG